MAKETAPTHPQTGVIAPPAEALRLPVVVSAPRQAMPLALQCYANESLFVRLFTRARNWLCPFAVIAERVPLVGRILDVGCGYGLFGKMLAIASPQRQVVGVDPSEEKIEVARRSGGLSNVSYRRGYVNELTDGPYDCVAVIDVLYLLPDDAKLDVLRACRRLINSDGVLLLKTNDTRPLWKFAILCVEEFIMVKLLRLTFGGRLHFRSTGQYTELLKQSGFDVAGVEHIDGWRPVPHRLFICKPAQTER